MKKKLSAILTAFIMSFATVDYTMAKDIVEIIVPTAPGGAVDITARAISKSLTDQGQENIVTYHPGANGEIAFNRIFEKQNNVVLVGSMATFVFTDVVNNKENQASKTMKLLGPSVTNNMFFVVGANSKFKTLKNLIAEAKSTEQPCGVSNSHGEILLKEMNQQYKTKFVPVMYKGTGQLIPDVVGGHTPCAFDQTAPYITLGDKIRWLGTSSDKTIKEGVPTIASALPNFYFENWYASAVPSNSNLLENKIVVRTLRHWSQNKEAVQPLVDRGFVPVLADPELNTKAAKETNYYRKLLNK
jgi:tripartite-type tricarboxylate transporter receptor subunit TctC